MKRLIKQRVTKELAYYLIIAEKYSYFRYQPEKALNMPLYVNDPTELVEELTRPIGPPFGPPKKNGYEYTRSFEHVNVWLNVETNESRLDWH
ncbi:MAG: putative glycoside hydrolase [Candidatus Sumerlaeota bacterium]|nr:putative glycoside hydrolase [Candidatus Sumerlaeota bacterium]